MRFISTLKGFVALNFEWGCAGNNGEMEKQPIEIMSNRPSSTNRWDSLYVCTVRPLSLCCQIKEHNTNLNFVYPRVLLGTVPKQLEVEPARRPPPRAVLDHHSAAALDLPRLLEEVQRHVAANQLNHASDQVRLKGKHSKQEWNCIFFLHSPLS